MYAAKKENEKGGMGINPQTLVRCLTSNLYYCIFSLVCYNKDTKRKENKKMFIINIFYKIGLIMGHLTGFFYKNFFLKNH